MADAPRPDEILVRWRSLMAGGCAIGAGHNPAAPIAMKGIFETTFQKFGMCASKLTANGGPVHSFHSLLRDLATCTLNEMTTTLNHAYSFTLVATPTPVQAHAFTLLDVDPTKL